MGTIRDAGNEYLRDFAVEGIPSSGDNNPIKSEGRAAFAIVDDRMEAVEAIATAGIRWLTQTIRVRSTANVVIATALENGDTLNGVTLATGDHVFLGSQTAPAENGIYTVVASGAASRATFADSAAELGLTGFLVSEGTVGAGERWTLPLLASAITLETTALTFARVGIEVSVSAEVEAARGAEASLSARLDADAVVQSTARNALWNRVDESTDPASPWFFNTWAYTLGRAAPTTAAEAAVSSRDSDYQLTLVSGGSSFVENGPIVVEDGTTGEITNYLVKTVSGNVLTTYEPLPANPVACEAMHKANLDPHLSRLAYNGLADALRAQEVRYSYKKETLFEFHGADSSSATFNDPDIYNSDASVKLIEVTALAGAVGGGLVAGTTNLTKFCTQDSANRGYGVDPSGYYQRGYLLRDSGIGKGFKFTVDLNSRDGFVEIVIGASPDAYTSDPGAVASKCAGTYRVKLTGSDATVFHNVVYKTGELKVIYVDVDGAETADLEVTLEEAVPTSVTLWGVYAYGKSPETPTGTLFQEGDVVAFLGDSWTQFPIAISPENEPLRPDGSTGDGMQFLSERLNDRMAADDTPITTLNWGKGGTTSSWGRYWISEIINQTPRPNKCVVHFYINDADSVDEYAADSDSAFDFNPTNQWAFQTKSTGGVKGSVSYALWYRNIQVIAAQLAAAGIQPIIMMPAAVASDATGQNIRDNQLSRMARGFRA